tara:strand:+ start:3535 stop:3903 length:369 start_codon:yes stop_codon:yes gene_type:complete
MEAKELRIGNYVNLICDGHEHEPDAFQWDVEDYEYYETEMINILPIPLTEEWLVEFGFKRTSFGRQFKGFYLEADSRVVSTDVLSSFSFEQIPDKKYLRITYVHQLQNLYFALINKELTIIK